MNTMTSYYKEKLKEGLHFQDFVIEQLYNIGLPIISYSSKEYQHLIGENKAGIEIKRDGKFKETGNIYIEVAEKSNPRYSNFISSGIYRNDNAWLYLIGDESIIYIFSKKHLAVYGERGLFKEVQTPTSRGFLIPIDKAEKLAIKIIIPDGVGIS